MALPIPKDFAALGRLFARITRTPAGCWIVTRGSKFNNGYALVTVSRRLLGTKKSPNVMAHRLTFQLMRGGLRGDPWQLDHLCRRRDCVNPWHLEQVSPGENVRRGDSAEATRTRRAAQTHCKHGHAWTPENTRTKSRRDANGKVYATRECITCRLAMRRAERVRLCADPVRHADYKERQMASWLRRREARRAAMAERAA